MMRQHPALGNIIWLFGRPGSGKTTLGFQLARDLGYLFMDSDLVRLVLGITPNFTVEGRKNYQDALRAHVRELQWGQNNIVVACITPLQSMRNWNRLLLDNYMEIYIECSLEEAIRRDPKGLYAKALAGELPFFTGIDSPFEEPTPSRFDENSLPDITIVTESRTIEESYSQLISCVANWRLNVK